MTWHVYSNDGGGDVRYIRSFGDFDGTGLADAVALARSLAGAFFAGSFIIEGDAVSGPVIRRFR